MGRMFNPPHPGETLREDVLPALGLTVTEAARQLGITRAALSRVLNGHAGISIDLARRIEAWLGVENGGRADVWLAQQLDCDLWQARQGPAPAVKRGDRGRVGKPTSGRALPESGPPPASAFESFGGLCDEMQNQ